MQQVILETSLTRVPNDVIEQVIEIDDNAIIIEPMVNIFFSLFVFFYLTMGLIAFPSILSHCSQKKFIF